MMTSTNLKLIVATQALTVKRDAKRIMELAGELSGAQLLEFLRVLRRFAFERDLHLKKKK